MRYYDRVKTLEMTAYGNTRQQVFPTFGLVFSADNAPFIIYQVSNLINKKGFPESFKAYPMKRDESGNLLHISENRTAEVDQLRWPQGDKNNPHTFTFVTLKYNDAYQVDYSVLHWGVVKN
jgi:pantothenate kinase